ncbi:unnamed protein product [Mytilus coruscus]|uniref:Death domain-containing protein n=1 Tax=Mytilus coruscus TaxID=42192 RepID=A0A6J8AUT5_MYTCO|nr:unnamed protein product [Mytilus coruscus]
MDQIENVLNPTNQKPRTKVTDEFLLKAEKCLQKTMGCGERFQNGLVSINQLLLDMKEEPDMDRTNNNNDIQTNDAIDINHLINKTENLLLRIREQIDCTCTNMNQLKNELIMDQVSTVNNTADEHLPKEKDKVEDEWKDSPLVFMNPRKNRFHHKVCCVLLTKPNTVNKGDLSAHASDADDDLAECLESNDEQIISSLVTLESKDGLIIHTQFPIHLYLPVVNHKPELIPQLKYLTNGNIWRREDVVQNIYIPIEREISFLGAEIQIQQLQTLQCVAVAVPPFEEFNIGKHGSSVTLHNDRNIKLNFPAGAFTNEAHISTKTRALTKTCLRDASERYLDLEHITQTTSIININCSQPPQSAFEINFYDFKIDDENISDEQEVLQRCKRWLMNNVNISLIESRLIEIFPATITAKIQKEILSAEKIQMLITELYHCSDNSIDKFIKILDETGQQEVVDRLNSVREQVILTRNQDDISLSEMEMSSDFDPDFEVEVKTVQIMAKLGEKPWKMAQSNSSNIYNVHTVKLDGGNSSYSVVGIVVPAKMTESDMCRAATVLEDVICLTNVNLVVKQHKDNSDEIIICCTKSDKLQETLQELAKDGFTNGPTKVPEFGLADSEKIEITLESFCLEGYENRPLVMPFYSGLGTARYRGRLCVLHPERLSSGSQYSGQLKYKIISEKISMQRSGKLAIYLPKPTDEQIGYFSYTFDFAGKALAKYLAWQLTPDNEISTRWIKFANILVADPNIYKHIINSISKDLCKAGQRQTCEAFLLYWADHYVKHDQNKLERMVDIFGHETQRKSDALQFLKPYCLSGTLSNDNLKKMAYCLADDWEVMAEKLKVDKSIICEIKDTQKNPVRQCLKMLDTWRLSDVAIIKGTDVVKHLYKCATAADVARNFSTYQYEGFSGYFETEMHDILLNNGRLFTFLLENEARTLSNDNLKKMAYCLADDWEVMAEKLKVDKSIICEIKDTQKNPVRQCLKMLDTWRLSDVAIIKGTDVVKHLYKCATAAGCGSKLLNLSVKH